MQLDLPRRASFSSQIQPVLSSSRRTSGLEDTRRQLDMPRRSSLSTQTQTVYSPELSQSSAAMEDPRKTGITLTRSHSAEDSRRVSVSLTRSHSAELDRRTVLVSPMTPSRDVTAGVQRFITSRSPSPLVRSESGPSPVRLERTASRTPSPRVGRVVSGPSSRVRRLVSGVALDVRPVRAERTVEASRNVSSSPLVRVTRRASLPTDTPWHIEEKSEMSLTQAPSPSDRRRASLPVAGMQLQQNLPGIPLAVPSISLHGVQQQETDISLSPSPAVNPASSDEDGVEPCNSLHGMKCQGTSVSVSPSPAMKPASSDDDGVESTVSGFSAYDLESDSLSSSGSAQHAHTKSSYASRERGSIRAMHKDLEHAMSIMPSSDPDSTLSLDDVAAKVCEAVREARMIGLTSEDEFVIQAERAFMLLSQREARTATREQLARLLTEFKKQCLRTADLETLQKWKHDINDALIAARGSNLPEAEIKEAELCRRKVHNRIEDLKGQVRVFCRVRPCSAAEKSRDDPIVVQAIDDMTVVVDGLEKFDFDCAFAPGTQAGVFEECSDLVQSAFDGFNVTIFSYGQTGAGKTYTMYGTSSDEGISGRAISEIFSIAEASSSWQETSVSASIVEMYNNDVLDVGSLVSRNPRSIYNKASACIGVKGSGELVGLAQMPVQSAEELKALLKLSLEHRTVASHAMNSQSSRSHFIFTVNVVTVNRETGLRTTGKLVLCDLAGSERLKRTEPEGVRRKEAIEINKSLTALGSVIEAVVRKQKQIPYRNHKLTQMLQDSIGGTAKTLMIVNCSPTSLDASETSMTLKFASKVKSITNTVDVVRRTSICA